MQAWQKVVAAYRRGGGYLKVTCRLSACTLGSAPDPTVGKEYGRTLPSTFTVVNYLYKSVVTILHFDTNVSV